MRTDSAPHPYSLHVSPIVLPQALAVRLLFFLTDEEAETHVTSWPSVTSRARLFALVPLQPCVPGTSPGRAESKWKLLLLLCCQHPRPTGCLDMLGGQRGVGRWGVGICCWGWAGLCTGKEAGTGWAAAGAQGRGRCHPPPLAPGLEAEPWATGACSPPPRLTDGMAVPSLPPAPAATVSQLGVESRRAAGLRPCQSPRRGHCSLGLSSRALL